MKFFFRDFLPEVVAAQLWGDRKKWGLIAKYDDPCWVKWQKAYVDFYEANQREGIGTKINDAGYKIVRKIDFSGKRILEIGPGDIRHIYFWKNFPTYYHLVDIDVRMLEKSCEKLKKAGIIFDCHCVERDQKLPFSDESIDIVLSFYSLEHIFPLDNFLSEINRILLPGGKLVGAIPTEGGLAWGLGRWMTSRRWFKRNTSINPDKIICWEHPNFADQIIAKLDKAMLRKELLFWPLPIFPILDVNFVLKFIYEKHCKD